MAYKQLRAPNFSTTGLPGWCLGVVLHAYDFSSGAYCARDEWDRNGTKRYDALPTDVAVPIFYSWIGTIDNVTRDFGDVAIHVPGRGVFGSPMSGGVANRWDSSIDSRRVAIGGGAKYLGWTEQLNGTNLIELIKGGEQPMTSAEENEVYLIATGSPMQQAATGRTALQFIRDAKPYFEIQRSHTAEVEQAVTSMKATIDTLSSRPTNEDYAKVQVQLNDKINDLVASQAALEAEKHKIKTVEVEPGWLTTAVNFIRKVLRIG